ncbi:MAG: membrane protein insertion efficiency factor YidD [Candidatus Kapaibacterium sp.]|nr:MAG: membrane protein insertion efficiency factor YidD [Candidatus Kapabacteria bacterium]
MKWLVLLILRAYQLVLSPMLPAACRFYPTCSEYAMQAVEKHGAMRGSWLAAQRIGRCHPWHAGGIDPVPESLPPCRCTTKSR